MSRGRGTGLLPTALTPKIQEDKNARTRSQTKLETAIIEQKDQYEDAETTIEINKNREIAQKAIQIEENKKLETKNTEQKIMDQQKIQQAIASFVPEFSGAENRNRTNELDRFLGTANSIYGTLNTQAEKEIFGQIIKFRLTGDAFTRVNRRQINTFEELEEFLTNMYTCTSTLAELERAMTNIHQNYNESIRNFGHRLTEALEQYKTGFKSKYKLEQIDATYTKHLDTVAIQAFKRGLNNTILKEKIATNNADKVSEIIAETEAMEKMLETATGDTTTHTQYKPQMLQPLNSHQTNDKIYCNYCQKPNHTWDVCRTRIFAERNNSRYNPHISNDQRRLQIQNYRNYYPPQRNNINSQRPPIYSTQQQFQTRLMTTQPQENFNNHRRQRINYTPYTPQTSSTQDTTQLGPNYNQNSSNYNQNTNYKQNQNYYQNNQEQPTQRNNQQKYCSYCKITTGHTFDECRNKLRGSGNQNYHYHQPTPNEKTLDEQFKSMRINTIRPNQRGPEPENHDHPQNQSENYNGSSER